MTDARMFVLFVLYALYGTSCPTSKVERCNKKNIYPVKNLNLQGLMPKGITLGSVEFYLELLKIDTRPHCNGNCNCTTPCTHCPTKNHPSEGQYRLLGPTTVMVK